MRKWSITFYRSVIKPGTDFCASSVLIVLFSPLCLLVAMAILLEDGRPVLFFQSRAGRRGREFFLVKFRSMRNHAVDPDTIGQVTGEHQLVTRVGRIIRRMKLDEIPQLYNVMKGEMSLVGPRPTLMSQVDGYDGFQRQRLDVRPGMTGWAQVNGNIKLSWEERIIMDAWYVNHCSFWLDLYILWRTVLVVFHGEHRNEKTLNQALRYARSCNRSSS